MSASSHYKHPTEVNPECNYWVEKWKRFLNIEDWSILFVPISEHQVVDALEGDTCGHEFVGIAINFSDKIGKIYHTRALHQDDIIHELLHVRFEKWSENKVAFWTNLLMSRRSQ